MAVMCELILSIYCSGNHNLYEKLGKHANRSDVLFVGIVSSLYSMFYTIYDGKIFWDHKASSYSKALELFNHRSIFEKLRCGLFL